MLYPSGCGFLVLHPRDTLSRTGQRYPSNWLIQELARDRDEGPECDELARWRGDIIVLKCQVEEGRIITFWGFEDADIFGLLEACTVMPVVRFNVLEKHINKL